VEDLRKVNQFNKDAAAYLRYSLMGATGTELDSAGRLLIPPNLREHAGLEKEVMLISILDKIEIWDKSKYQQFFDSFTQEKYDELQQRVMGGPGVRNEK
jgi:MraZ protein